VRAQGSWSEGDDGAHPTYAERLRPPLALWILVAGLSALMGMAYGAAYGAGPGWLAGAGIAALGATLLLVTTTPLRVDDRVVRAGRARLPLAAISEAIPLDAEEMRQARRHGDPRDYLVLRSWSSSRGVSIVLADARDPHPRWVVSSRHPDRFAAAINAALADPARDQPRHG
jgi:hypothetical protein